MGPVRVDIGKEKGKEERRGDEGERKGRKEMRSSGLVLCERRSLDAIADEREDGLKVGTYGRGRRSGSESSLRRERRREGTRGQQKRWSSMLFLRGRGADSVPSLLLLSSFFLPYFGIREKEELLTAGTVDRGAAPLKAWAAILEKDIRKRKGGVGGQEGERAASSKSQDSPPFASASIGSKEEIRPETSFLNPLGT